MATYEDDRQAAQADPAGFWAARAKDVDWFTGPTATPPGTGAWFVEGGLNATYNVLDLHVIRGLADEPALVVDTDTARGRTVDYAELLERTAQLGGVLRGIGIQPGESLLIHLPQVPELVIALLACARTGIVAVVVDPARSATELAARIDDVGPGVILSASCTVVPATDGGAETMTPLKPVLDEALALADHAPVHCLVVQRRQYAAELTAPRDLDVSLLMKPGGFEPAVCAELPAAHPLDASGAGQGPTTVAWSYGLTQAGVGVEDLVLTAADLELRPHLLWAPLLCGAAVVLTERDLGAAGGVAAAVARHGVTALITEDPTSGTKVPQDDGSLRTVLALDPAPWWIAAQ